MEINYTVMSYKHELPFWLKYIQQLKALIQKFELTKSNNFVVLHHCKHIKDIFLEKW